MPKAKEIEGVQEAQPIVAEFECSPDDDLHKVVRSFMLKVKDGPLTEVKPGQVVRLSSKTAMEAFYGNEIEPICLGEKFKAIHPFTFIVDGYFVTVSPGDILKMSREEGLAALRRQEVVEVKEENGGAL